MASREIVPANHWGHIVVISKISDFFMGWKFCCKPQNTHIKTFATESTEKVCGLHISSDSTWRLGQGCGTSEIPLRRPETKSLPLRVRWCASSKGWSLSLWLSQKIKDRPRKQVQRGGRTCSGGRERIWGSDFQVHVHWSGCWHQFPV